LPPPQRNDLTITLREGRALSGTVLDQAGRPVVAATVQTVFGRRGHAADHDIRIDYRKATLTDGKGAFELRGLPNAVADVYVRKTDGSGPILCGHAEVELRSAAKGAAKIVADPFTLPPGQVT